jgi:hypothetical protein
MAHATSMLCTMITRLAREYSGLFSGQPTTSFRRAPSLSGVGMILCSSQKTSTRLSTTTHKSGLQDGPSKSGTCSWETKTSTRVKQPWPFLIHSTHISPSPTRITKPSKLRCQLIVSLLAAPFTVCSKEPARISSNPSLISECSWLANKSGQFLPGSTSRVAATQTGILFATLTSE